MKNVKILAAATPAGAAEALAPVIRELSALGHTMKLIGVTNDTPETKPHGGSSNVFRRQKIPFTDLFDLGYRGSVVHVSSEFVRSIVEDEKPYRVLVGCTRDPSGTLSSVEDALIETSQMMGIKALQVIDGWDAWFPRNTGYYATAFAVQDSLAKEILVRRGKIPEERIFVTGQPALDTATRDELLSRRRQERGELGLTHERVLVYFGQVNSQNPLSLKWTVRAMRSDDRLIFQRHPRDQRNYSETLSILGNRLIGHSLPTLKALSVADVCITHHSTMGLHAVSLGIPTINILLNEDLRDIREICGGYPLARMGLSKEVHSEAELAAVLADNLKPFDKEKARRLLSLDGGSVDRIIEVLLGNRNSGFTG